MGHLSDDLREMNFVTTGEESPLDSEGTIWRKGVERVCDETGVVIDGNHREDNDKGEEERSRYRNSGRVIMCGGPNPE